MELLSKWHFNAIWKFFKCLIKSVSVLPFYGLLFRCLGGGISSIPSGSSPLKHSNCQFDRSCECVPWMPNCSSHRLVLLPSFIRFSLISEAMAFMCLSYPINSYRQTSGLAIGRRRHLRVCIRSKWMDDFELTLDKWVCPPYWSIFAFWFSDTFERVFGPRPVVHLQTYWKAVVSFLLLLLTRLTLNCPHAHLIF